MKKRITFISNSSSSSFVVISDGELDQLDEDVSLLVPTDKGEYEFGWQQEKYNDFYSKLNFCTLQCLNVWDTKGKNWFKMLKKVIEDKLHINLELDEHTAGYIDHQSSAYEGSNTEMFDSEYNLIQFLFSSDSYIENDNDNH